MSSYAALVGGAPGSPGTSQSSSKWPMWARSQHSGDISSDTCTRCSSSGTGASNARVRRRDSSSEVTIWDLVTTSDLGGRAPGPLVEQVVGGAARTAHEARCIL